MDLTMPIWVGFCLMLLLFIVVNAPDETPAPPVKKRGQHSSRDGDPDVERHDIFF